MYQNKLVDWIVWIIWNNSIAFRIAVLHAEEKWKAKSKEEY